MIIETKFNLGDEAWVVANRGLFKFRIGYIKVSIFKSTNNIQYYSVQDIMADEPFDEKCIFKTKQELIDSL